MYGRYTKELGEFAKEEARRLKAIERRRRKDDKRRNKELHKYNGPCMSRISSVVGFIWHHTFAKLGEDWVFLALLGIIMAFISFAMDMGIGMCNKGIFWREFLFQIPDNQRGDQITFLVEVKISGTCR
jgi:chloride channel 2